MSEEEQIILPEGFKRLTHIYDSGTQWIDTGYIPDGETGLFIDAQQITYNDGYPMGVGKDNTGITVPRKLTNDAYSVSYSAFIILGSKSSTTRYTATTNWLNDRKIITELGEQNLPSLNFTPTGTINLFRSTSNRVWKGRIYRAKISQGTEVVRDFIPAFDLNRDEACMYDIINDTPYYNVGSNDFLFDDNPYAKENEVIGVIGKLPEGFTRLPNLIANGKQWIDTSYVPTNETGYYIKAQTSQTDTTWRPIFGLFQRDIENNPRIYLYTNPYPCLGWNTTASALTSSATFSKEKMVAEFNFLNSRKLIIDVNENELSYDLPNLEFTPTNSLYLFSANGQGTSMYGYISTFIISEGSEIVREFVPCLDTEEVACMYELYTGTVHYNQGAGQFSTLKYNILPTYNLPANYKKCLYLQSDGTQYIDTDIFPNDETGLLIKALAMGESNGCPIGSGNTMPYVYPPRKTLSSNKQIAYAWNAWYDNSSVILNWDKGGDLNYTSYVNLYNNRMVYFNSEDTDYIGLINNDILPQLETEVRLFNWSVDSSMSSAPWIGRIYRAQITQGDTLIRDFVPALDANNKPCMYDLINDECYYNQGTGKDFAYCLEHHLPSDFIKLKYLESDNNQHIKTGYVPTNNTGMYVDGYNTVVADTAVMGMQNTTSGNDRVWMGGVMKATYGARYGWGSITTPNGTGDVRFEQTLNWLNDKKSIITCPAFAQKINTLSNLSFTPNKDIYFFGWNRAGSLAHWKGRIYRAKISEGAEIVRDFIPAYDTRRSKPCMYDLINNVAYYNDGSDEFLSNRDFEGTYTGFGMLGGIGNKLGSIHQEMPWNFTKLDYLESNGEQWIDTGIIVNTPNIDFEITFLNNDNSKYRLLQAGKNFTYTLTWISLPISDTQISKGGLSAPQLNTKHTAIFRKNEFILDGVEQTIPSSDGFGEIVTDYEYTTMLFSFITPTAETNYKDQWFSGRVYSCKLALDGVAVRDFIPCLDNNNRPCMFDTISQQPFYNQGDGEDFTYGMIQ